MGRVRGLPRRGGDSQPDPGPVRLPLGPPHRPGRLLLLSVVAAVLTLGAVGCGGGGGSAATLPSQGSTTTSGSATAAGGGSTTLHLEADASGALRFDKQTLTAPAGKVTIVMKNPSPLSHDIAIEGNGVDMKGPVVSTNGTSTVTAVLKPGTYTFLCTVDGHADAGMKGTLTVS